MRLHSDKGGTDAALPLGQLMGGGSVVWRSNKKCEKQMCQGIFPNINH